MTDKAPPDSRTNYLLIGDILFSVAEPAYDDTDNLYPVSLGMWLGDRMPGTFPSQRARNGDTVRLWGHDYEVNHMVPRNPDCEASLELVRLSEPDDSEFESGKAVQS